MVRYLSANYTFCMLLVTGTLIQSFCTCPLLEKYLYRLLNVHHCRNLKWRRRENTPPPLPVGYVKFIRIGYLSLQNAYLYAGCCPFHVYMSCQKQFCDLVCINLFCSLVASYSHQTVGNEYHKCNEHLKRLCALKSNVRNGRIIWRYVIILLYDSNNCNIAPFWHTEG